MSRELLQQALDALEEATAYTSSPSWSPSMTEECTAVAASIRAHLAAQPAPVPCARNELVTAIHSLASNFENSMYAFRDDTEARRKATGDIAHAMKIAAKHNQNGPGCSAAPVPVPLTDEMDAVASQYAHRLALDLECVLSDYNGRWWDTAMNTLGEYRSAMNAIHERESPTFMGEPSIAASPKKQHE
jgi:hypothetical protein